MQELAKQFVYNMEQLAKGVHTPKTKVVVVFKNSGVIRNAQVEAAIIDKDTVHYDVSIKMEDHSCEFPISFTSIKRVHSKHVLTPDEFSDQYKSQEIRKPTLRELQSILQKMDYYKSTSGLIAPVWGGELTFFAEKTLPFPSRPITRDEVLKMINETDE